MLLRIKKIGSDFYGKYYIKRVLTSVKKWVVGCPSRLSSKSEVKILTFSTLGGKANANGYQNDPTRRVVVSSQKKLIEIEYNSGKILHQGPQVQFGELFNKMSLVYGHSPRKEIAMLRSWVASKD